VSSETNLRKILQIFLQFFVFQCEASGRLLLASGRVEISRPDGSAFVKTHAAPNGRMVRIVVRTRATCPLVSNAARVRMALIHRPDGDPTDSIKAHGRRFSTLPHQNLSFWHLVSYYL
jgi:hypothetical protein